MFFAVFIICCPLGIRVADTVPWHLRYRARSGVPSEMWIQSIPNTGMFLKKRQFLPFVSSERDEIRMEEYTCCCKSVFFYVQVVQHYFELDRVMVSNCTGYVKFIVLELFRYGTYHNYLSINWFATDLTLLHLPPLWFHCVGGCWVRTQRYCDFGIGSQTLLPIG
jgi:hypothetical protein